MSAPVVPPIAPPAPMPASVATMGPAAMNGPTPGIASMPMPASHPNAPPITAPVPPPATAPSADFVPFSWPNSFEPTFCGKGTAAYRLAREYGDDGREWRRRDRGRRELESSCWKTETAANRLVHGDADTRVPTEQSILMRDALQQAGRQVQLFPAVESDRLPPASPA
jgi:hypothetical protein